MKIYFLLILAFFTAFYAHAQYQLNGSAFMSSPTCYTLTPALNSQAGSVWYTNQIDLNQPFELSAQIFLGCNDGGADGMVFAFQSVSTSVGSLGGGMGYSGISPSIGIEFDTWYNSGNGDLVNDHMAIISNGSVSHLAATNLVGPVNIIPNGANAEDCMNHDLHISWNPTVDSLKVYFDCNLRLEYQGDIVNTIFGGNPNVFWGFTAGTGAANNLHRFCIDYLSFGLDTLVCVNDTLQLTVGGGTAYSWSPATGLSNPNIANPLAFPATTTTYTATIFDNCGFTRSETFTIEIVQDSLLNIDLGNDTVVCPGQTIVLDAYRPGPTYLWQNGSTDSVFNATTAGLYWVELENICGTRRDSIDITAEVPPVVNLGNDTTLCPGEFLNLDVTFFNSTYLWSSGSTLPNFNVDSPGLFWAQVDNICGTASDTIVVDYETPPTPVDLGRDTILCNNATYTLDVSQPNATYLWQDGSTSPTFVITGPGLYWAEVIKLCGTSRDSVFIVYDNIPVISLANDTIVCEGEVFTLNVPGSPLSTYLWQDGTTNPTMTVAAPGLYSVIVTNFCGADTASKNVDYLSPPPAFDLGPDSQLCEGNTLTLNTGRAGFNHLWHDGSTATSYTITSPGTYHVHVSNMCGSVRDTVVATYTASPTLDLGDDRILCDGETLLLDASWPGATYRWQNGRTEPTYLVINPGVYSVKLSHHCGDREDEIAVDFVEKPRPFSLGPDQDLCEGETILLDIFQPGFNHEWQDGSETPTFLVTYEGTIKATVYNQCGEETDEMKVVYYPYPEAVLGQDTIICERDAFVMSVNQGQRVKYTWQDGSTKPEFEVTQAGAYSVQVENLCGFAADSVIVEEHPCFCSIHAPTAFTPNDDTYNDEFRLFYECDIISGTLKVFDRWGVQVFGTDSPDAAWDGTFRGKGSPEGVYVWAFEYQYQEADRVKTVKESGTVTLFR
ncbi:MAG: gliding motility-associated C-terminal domain-containing protein [Bacteroidetes bacterium]|nr:gliding motility-associated C-terminal domain-containing protein [Bacteroidota bacterium]